MWTVFKDFIEFATILLLFHALVFWPQSTWDLHFPTRFEPTALALEGGVFTTGLPRKSRDEQQEGQTEKSRWPSLRWVGTIQSVENLNKTKRWREEGVTICLTELERPSPLPLDLNLHHRLFLVLRPSDRQELYHYPGFVYLSSLQMADHGASQPP